MRKSPRAALRDAVDQFIAGRIGIFDDVQYFAMPMCSLCGRAAGPPGVSNGVTLDAIADRYPVMASCRWLKVLLSRSMTAVSCAAAPASKA